MQNCGYITSPKSKVSIGDLNTPIQIIARHQTRNNLQNNQDINAILSVYATFWAKQKTINGEEVFDATNSLGKITDEFYIRFNKDKPIKKHHYLLNPVNNQAYDIIDIKQDVHNQHTFTVLRCIHKGDNQYKINIK
jgi:SPP1 family predicted phage head-tail adaptor